MPNSIDTQRSTMGSSMALNNQKGSGAMKPSEKGNHSPGGTKPPRADDGDSPTAIPMPKGPRY